MLTRRNASRTPQVRNEFYKDTQGCILVYDVTNRACFEALEGWLKEAKDNGAENMVCLRLLSLLLLLTE